MAIDELIMQVVKFFPLIITIIAIIAVISGFVAPSVLSPGNFFNDLCSAGNELAVLSDINYDSSTSLIQFMISEDTSMEFVYPRNTYDILETVYNRESDINDLSNAVNSMKGLSSSRLNYRFFEACKESSCLCVVRTGSEVISYENLDYTACFPRLYAYAHDSFDNYFNSISESNTVTAFRETTNHVLSELSSDTSEEAQEIIACYDLFDTYSFNYEGLEGKFFLTMNYKTGTSLTSQDSYTIVNSLTNFYDLTKAGLFNQVAACYSIPDDNDCACPYLSNTMIVKDQTLGTGVFLGVAGSNYQRGIISGLSVDLIGSLEYSSDACLIEVGES